MNIIQARVREPRIDEFDLIIRQVRLSFCYLTKKKKKNTRENDIFTIEEHLDRINCFFLTVFSERNGG